jgi:DNA-binding beta-propeller fold protein YncE
VALDKVNNRLFIGHHGNSRYDIYQLGEDGLPDERHAVETIGRNMIGRGFAWAPLGTQELNFPSGGEFDPVYQRLILPDYSSLGPPGARILVFDIAPDTLAALERGELPEATAVLGQPHFDTWDPGLSRSKIASRARVVIDPDRQLAFITDSANHRVLVWDIHPDRLESGMDAMTVIGQSDFVTNIPTTNASGLRSPSDITYNPERQELFVSDSGNNRVLVFSVSDAELARETGLEAFAVIGQDDFTSREIRTDLRKLKAERIGIDYRYHRLFNGEQFGNRVMVFDVNPDILQGAINPDAIAVLGQPNYQSTDPAVTQTRLTMPRITLDVEKQIAYVPDGYPAGNRINMFDIHPDRMQEFETPIVDQIGHINPEGEPDFLARSANDRTSSRYWTQARDISIDTVDHRLFVSDNYGHRVMVFELDRMNRPLERGASWALGQPDTSTSQILPGRDATTIKLPLSMEYDESQKRLFVADTWNDRVLVFDMTPGQVDSGMEASYVLGQQDFTSYEPATSQNRIFFGSRDGRGIYPSEARAAEIAMDKENQRIFVTDGGNHRVLVFDVDPDRIANGANAIAVLGQDDFTSSETGLSATRWELPGDLVYDEKNHRLFVGVAWQHRVLVFDVHPDRLINGKAADYVIGQPNFEIAEPGLSDTKFRQTDGLSYDSENDRLYLTDKYNHRVMVFDVDPENMGNMPEALSVIGEPNFDETNGGPGNPRHHQDRLHDPRGNVFDSAGQRLYQSEGLNGRLTVFTMPREEYELDLPARSSLQYASLDAMMSTGPEALESGFARADLQSPSGVVAVSAHYVTRQDMHDQSERFSRELVSQAILPAVAPQSKAMVFVTKGEDRDVQLALVNSGDRAVAINFTLRSVDGDTLNASRSIAAGEQLEAGAGDLFPRQSAFVGALTIDADAPVAMSALLQVQGNDGNLLLSPAPIVIGQEVISKYMGERRILPGVTTGAGHDLTVVLLNPESETLSGQIELPDQTAVRYQIAPGESFVHVVAADGRIPMTGFGIVRAEQGPAPAAFALSAAQLRDGSTQSVHLVGSAQEGTLFWAPVNTHPDVLHHGSIDTELSLVNEGEQPATAYLEWYDLDGNSVGRYEQIVPLGEQVAISLEEVFGQSPMRGTVRVFSDVDVAASLLEKTNTFTGRDIATSIPLQTTPDSSHSSVVFPLFRNGEGQATEALLINTDREHNSGSLTVIGKDGNTRSVILR